MRLAREHNDRAWLAWHVAYFTRVQRMPALRKYLIQGPRRRQTWQEQMAVMGQWIAVTQRREQILREAKP